MASVIRNSKIQVLYASSGATPDNGDLFDGELAYSYGQKELYIGGGNSTDVTFVGAEILRSGDSPFTENRSDNNLATTQAIYDYVDGQLGDAAGVTTVEGVTGAVNLVSADAFLTISAGTHPDKAITFDIVTDDETIGVTATNKLGLLSDSVGTVHIQDNAVELGTQTTGNYVASLVAGDLIDISNNSGEGATPTINVDLSELGVMTDPVVGDDQMIIFDTSSSVQLKKQISGIPISVFNTADQITLGTDTTGNYVGSVSALSTSGIAVSGIVGENMAANISLKNYINLTNNKVMIWDDGNGQLSNAPMGVNGTNMEVDNDLSVGGTLEVDGNMIVRGNLTTLDVVNVKVEDPMIILGATTGTPPSFDIGFAAKYDATNWTGLVRDDSDSGLWYLFDSYSDSDLSTASTINSPGTNATVAELRAHIVAGTFS